MAAASRDNGSASSDLAKRIEERRRKMREDAERLRKRGKITHHRRSDGVSHVLSRLTTLLFALGIALLAGCGRLDPGPRRNPRTVKS